MCYEQGLWSQLPEGRVSGTSGCRGGNYIEDQCMPDLKVYTARNASTRPECIMWLRAMSLVRMRTVQNVVEDSAS